MHLNMRAVTAHIALLLALLLGAFFQSTTAVSNSACNSDSCWEQINAGNYYQLGGYSAVGIPYLNTINATVTGIVFMVVHNYLGQTVEISTATLQLGAGANGTAFLIRFGLESGTYSATFFVTEPSGVSISTTATETFTV